MNQLLMITYLLQKKIHKPESSGFTLIELLVVLIIIGILSAVALPSLINQVGKAKEAETLGMIGAISRAQQAYFWENGIFANDISLLVGGGTGKLTGKFHEIKENAVTDLTSMISYKATIINPNEQARNFALGVYHNVGEFSTAICQSADVGGDVDVGSTSSDDCTNGGKRLR